MPVRRRNARRDGGACILLAVWVFFRWSVPRNLGSADVHLSRTNSASHLVSSERERSSSPRILPIDAAVCGNGCCRLITLRREAVIHDECVHPCLMCRSASHQLHRNASSSPHTRHTKFCIVRERLRVPLGLCSAVTEEMVFTLSDSCSSSSLGHCFVSSLHCTPRVSQ